MRVVLQCLYSESWLDIAKVVVPNIVGYARKHDYLWNIQCFKDYPSDFGYEKFRQIKDLFDSGETDVVVSLDCDLLITNYNKKIEDFLNESHDFYITYGANTYNAGVFILKKSEWAYWFIDYILSKQGKLNMHCEQDAIIEYIREFGTKDICIVPHPSFNSFNYRLYPEWPEVRSREEGCWALGDFILHLPGIGMEQRLNIIKNIPVIL